MHTCTWTTDDRCEIIEYQADRAAARILAAGGLHDVAPTIGAPWTPIAEHHSTKALGMDRGNDFTHATAAMIKRITRHEVYDTPQARRSSDHLPQRHVVDQRPVDPQKRPRLTRAKRSHT